jgi:hypothetical protein
MEMARFVDEGADRKAAMISSVETTGHIEQERRP